MRECLAYLDVGNQIVEEGPLAAERFQGPVRLDASMVDPARQIVKPFGAVAEMRRQPRHLLRRQVGPREEDRPSVRTATGVSVRVNAGVPRILQKKNKRKQTYKHQ